VSGCWEGEVDGRRWWWLTIEEGAAERLMTMLPREGLLRLWRALEATPPQHSSINVCLNAQLSHILSPSRDGVFNGGPSPPKIQLPTLRRLAPQRNRRRRSPVPHPLIFISVILTLPRRARTDHQRLPNTNSNDRQHLQSPSLPHPLQSLNPSHHPE
jgi:hypothetical protein